MREYKKKITNLSACIDYLLRLSVDYQFDKSDDHYCGFINTDPREHLSENRITFLVENVELLNSVLMSMGINRIIESANREELILTKETCSIDD